MSREWRFYLEYMLIVGCVPRLFAARTRTIGAVRVRAEKMAHTLHITSVQDSLS